MLRFLLLQARQPDDPIRQEERASFAEALAIAPEQIDLYNLLDGPPGSADLDQGDAILIGGSGEYYVSQGDLPQQARLYDTLREAVERDRPMFCSCFGFHILVEALGGQVVHDPDKVEVGTVELSLTEEGKVDPVFGALPTRFRAQLGRKDRAAELPNAFENLATSSRCRLQGFRVPGRAVWAAQFHPELTAEANRRRFERYLEVYAKHLGPEERAATLEQFQESPEASSLLGQFVKVVFG